MCRDGALPQLIDLLRGFARRRPCVGLPAFRKREPRPARETERSRWSTSCQLSAGRKRPRRASAGPGYDRGKFDRPCAAHLVLIAASTATRYRAKEQHVRRVIQPLPSRLGHKRKRGNKTDA